MQSLLQRSRCHHAGGSAVAFFVSAFSRRHHPSVGSTCHHDERSDDGSPVAFSGVPPLAFRAGFAASCRAYQPSSPCLRWGSKRTANIPPVLRAGSTVAPRRCHHEERSDEGSAVSLLDCPSPPNLRCDSKHAASAPSVLVRVTSAPALSSADAASTSLRNRCRQHSAARR